jgi:hypothetical protein
MFGPTLSSDSSNNCEVSNFVSYLQKTFRTDTKRGKVLFALTTYSVYWLIFYGIWFAAAFFSQNKDTIEINPDLGLGELFIAIQILAPFALILVSIFINRVTKISKIRLIIYSIIVLAISVTYAIYAILFSIGKSYTGF